MRVLLVSIWGLFLCAVSDAAQAAVFVLATGGQVEGELLNPDERPRQTYVVRTVAGGTITLDKSQVERVHTISEDLKWYREALPKVSPTVEGHWEMAEECRKRGLRTQRDFHLQEILKLNPEHQEARYGLGYSKIDGRWVNADEWNRAHGYVRHQGAWRIPQDVVLEQQADELEKAQKDWMRKVKTWATSIAKRRGGEQEAIQAIRDIRDPRAAPALVQLLEDTRQPLEVRLLSTDVLGKLQAPEAIRAFVKQAMEDRDAHIRDACLDQLAKFGTLQAVRAFQQLLKSKDNWKVNRAAICLGSLRDPDATLALINALITEHTSIEQSGGAPGQLNLGFGSGPGGGGNSFGVGGRPKVIKRKHQNESVLNALVAIHPGVNFGYDIEKWKKWFADRHDNSVTNLRRDG
jgi:hypothetical protein